VLRRGAELSCSKQQGKHGRMVPHAAADTKPRAVRGREASQLKPKSDRRSPRTSQRAVVDSNRSATPRGSTPTAQNLERRASAALAAGQPTRLPCAETRFALRCRKLDETDKV
jgi:hypothetical protein